MVKMFDPDYKDGFASKPEDNKLRIAIRYNTDDQEHFNWYFRNATQVREAYGIGKTPEDKPVVVDQKKLDALQPWEKDKVRIAWKAWVGSMKDGSQ